MSSRHSERLLNTLKLAWHGKLSLPMAWWLIFVPYMGLSRVLVSLLSEAVTGRVSYVLYAMVWAMLLVGAVAVYVMVWRCAENSATKLWGNLAQGFVLLSALFTAFKVIAAIGKLM